MSTFILNTYLAENTLDKYMKENCIDKKTNDDINVFQKLANRRYVHEEKCDQNLINVNFNEILIGDVIHVSYCTYSQRYMCEEEYQSFTRKVFFIDNENQNILFYYNQFDKSTKQFVKIITSLSRPYCSYYGDQRGYSLSIYKLI